MTLSKNRTMKIIAELKAKITDPQRFAAAMSIVGNTPADKLASLSVGDSRNPTRCPTSRRKSRTLTTERDGFRTARSRP
jgi:hypothetical protein